MAKMRDLGRLLAAEQNHGIATALRDDVARATAWLQNQPPGPAALFLADTHLFAIWLLACWQNGRYVILPGDATPATTQHLQLRGALLLGDFSGAARRDCPQEGLVAALRICPDSQPAVEVFTSGTTGAPISIVKALHQLNAEVQVLDKVFGASLPCDLEFHSTVSHQHLYGLLFCILWPLVRGQQALASLVTYPEELLVNTHDYVLISSPAFLKRLPSELPWPIPSRCRQIFSSGGPLPASAALKARECLGASVTEIYGSSETGGIARRNDPAADWTVQPGVEVRLEENGCLAVRSAFLPDTNWFVTADRARLTDGGFVLAGRDDRIVKIEEKRISLTALETALQAHEWISEVRVVPLEGSRLVLAAVAVLSPTGQAALSSKGKFALSQALRTALAGEFERVALPRRWRFVSHLPVNPMGKTTDLALVELFTAKQNLPLVIQQHATATGIALQLELKPELACFDGHFPNLPILPGVAQLEWAVHFGCTLLGAPTEFQGMDAIKFQQIIRPGSQIELVLDYLPAKQQLQFRYQSASGQHSSGRIRLGEPSA
ncbi:MAG: AMP-binding protein [Formivibrio sp.]|nr:AMP-binding protein [Formivibrio sp.]